MGEEFIPPELPIDFDFETIKILKKTNTANIKRCFYIITVC